jgi:aldose 1-epimerase
MNRTTITPFHEDFVIDCIFPQGSSYRFFTVGASFVQWISPHNVNLVAGYCNLSSYGTGGLYLGTTIGPTAGRIENSEFSLNGLRYQLDNKEHHYLHGGSKGIHTISFQLKSIVDQQDLSVITFHTKYQHDVIPGVISLDVIYECTSKSLTIHYHATSTEDTILNLTNHSYFSLLGDYEHDLYHHFLELDSSKVILVDNGIIGKEILEVKDTCFDFTSKRLLSQAILDPVLLHQSSKGIDHCFLLDHNKEYCLKLYASTSPYILVMKTSYPALTLYTSNYRKDQLIHTHKKLGLHGAIAIEPQYPSNGINDSRFHSCILKTGERYQHFISYHLQEEHE